MLRGPERWARTMFVECGGLRVTGTLTYWSSLRGIEVGATKEWVKKWMEGEDIEQFLY